jgi:hypothetical protein
MLGPYIIGFAFAFDEAENAMGRQRLAGRPHRQVYSVADTAGRQADIPAKIISLAIAQASGHGRRLARDQPVECAT